MIGNQIQLLQHETVSNAAMGTSGATTVALPIPSVVGNPLGIPWGQEPFWIMIVRLGAVPTGTTPSITPTLQLSTNGGAFANVAAGTAISTVIAQVTAFSAATIVPSYSNANTYTLRVLLTLGNADNVSTDTSVDLISLI